jgi:hypothetical protein
LAKKIRINMMYDKININIGDKELAERKTDPGAPRNSLTKQVT